MSTSKEEIAARVEAMDQKPGMWSFLKTEIPPEKLKIALEVMLAFRTLETRDEWLRIPFDYWRRFEQLQEYLQLLTDTDADDVDDPTSKEFLKLIRTRRQG